MRFGGALLVLAVGGAAVYVAGVLVLSPPLAMRGALVGLAALAGYVVVAGRGVDAWVRWPLVIATAGVWLAVATDRPWMVSGEYGWFELAPGPTGWWDRLLRAVGPYLWLSLSLLAIAVAAIVAASRLNGRAPEQRVGGDRRWLVAGTAVAGLAMLALTARNAWVVVSAPVTDPEDERLVEMVVVGAVPLAAGLAALAVAVVAARRAASGWLGGVGGLLLALNAFELTNLAIAWVPAAPYASIISLYRLTMDPTQTLGILVGYGSLAIALAGGVLGVVLDLLRAARDRVPATPA